MMFFFKDKVRLLFYGGIVFVVFIFLFLFLKHSKKCSKFIFEPGLVVSTGTFTRPLYNVLSDYKVEETEKHKMVKLLSESLNLKNLRENDEYLVITSTSGILKFIKIRKDLKDYFVFRSSQSVFSFSKRDVEIKSEIFKSSGTIASSLWESMISNSINPEVILDFADIFSCSVDFLTEVRNGDTYKVVYEISKTDTGKPVSKKVLAGLYDGAETGRKTAVLFKDNYYDETGDSLKSFFLKAPLQYRRISSYFSLRRFHPVLRIVRPHYGIDYAAPTGTPVSSVADGIVTFAGWNGGYGKFIQIQHNSVYTTGYGHLSEYAKNIRPGVRVKQGQVIGYVGATGLATGPHLDFSIKKNGKYINFLKIKRFRGTKLSKNHMEEFKSMVNQYFDKI